VSVQSHDLHLLTGAYAVDALTGDELAEFEKHLEQCAPCAEEVSGLLETAARLGLATAIAPPPSMRDQVLAATNRVRQLPPSGTRPVAAGPPRRVKRLRRVLPRPIAVSAMAAAIVALAVLQVGTRHQLEQAQGWAAGSRRAQASGAAAPPRAEGDHRPWRLPAQHAPGRPRDPGDH